MKIPGFCESERGLSNIPHFDHFNLPKPFTVAIPLSFNHRHLSPIPHEIGHPIGNNKAGFSPVKIDDFGLCARFTDI
jgi:hypothetical protein